MRHLSEMVADTRKPDRPRVAVWAHSAAPEIEIDCPGTLLASESTGDGILEDVRTVARFRFAEADAKHIQGNANIAFDLVFNDEPYPLDPDDNLMKRSRLLISTASEFIRSLERSVGDRPPLRPEHRSMASFVRPSASSPWGPIDLRASPQGSEIETALSESDLGLAAYYDPDGNITMLLRSGDTIYGRPIPPALPLDPNVVKGTAAEDASLAVACMWGLPDFVMRPSVIRKGTGSRELGDGTIICGQRGLAIQVKSRRSDTGDQAREMRWVLKKAAEGARQACGTVRSLRLGPVDLVSLRGNAIKCDGSGIEWAGVVIIDHPALPEVVVTPSITAVLPTVILARRDWDFLFDHLRSASAVVDYVHRVCQHEPRALGKESIRYYELAHADELATTRPSPRWITDLGAHRVSRPVLPKEPASVNDSVGHTVFRIILDDIATAETNRDEWERLTTLAWIDRVSVSTRAGLGRLLLTHLDEVRAASKDSTLWRFRRLIQDEGFLQLAFGACSHLTALHREAFRQWCMIRHEDFVSLGVVPAGETPTTVAVLLTPRYDRRRPWDTTMIAMRGDLDLPPEELASMRSVWTGTGDGTE